MLYVLDNHDQPVLINYQDYFLIEQQRRENRHIIYCDKANDYVISTVFFIF
ncbi:hypothetical protein [Piscirickettsia litoralis]|uniref:hypothetical protein n=1 Tax=Piscirickettsia litoralis TaxID=1891921 RepID=UPI0013012EA4|nr:hypothetical protein [Piscirickettsia litoralis]